MAKLFPQKESEMYPVIKEYFSETLKCNRVFIDSLRLTVNLSKGRVDITALEDVGENEYKIHLLEAKMLNKRHIFHECIDQIVSIKHYGNYLWVAFPEREWDCLEEAEKKRNEEVIKEKELGLLLVSKNECYPKIKAPFSKISSEENRNIVLEKLGLSIENEFLHTIETLGSEESRKAANTLLLMDLSARHGKEYCKNKRKEKLKALMK